MTIDSSASFQNNVAGSIDAIATFPREFYLVSPAVAFFAAVLAVSVTLYLAMTQRRIDRIKSTFDLISNSEFSKTASENSAVFSQYRRSNSFSLLEKPANEAIAEHRRQTLDFLNHYELIAIGIKEGLVEEELYKSFMRSVVVRDSAAAKEFVQHIRTPTEDSGSEASANSAFCEFEALAKKWAPEVKRNIPFASAKSR